MHSSAEIRACQSAIVLVALLFHRERTEICAQLLDASAVTWLRYWSSVSSSQKSTFSPRHLFLRALGRSSIRQRGGVLRRSMGLPNGQPFRWDTKKNCFFLPAWGGLSHLCCHPKTVQRATEDLPAGSCPPTHCHLHFNLP